MDLATLEPRQTGCAMSDDDEIDELLIEWYRWQSEYQPKTGYGRVSPAFRDYRGRWADSDDVADRAQAAARKAVCESVDACVSRLDLRGRVAIQTEMRNRLSGAISWSSIRLPGPLDEEYLRAKRLLQPMFLDRRLIDERVI
jgi:hypothetical protein